MRGVKSICFLCGIFIIKGVVMKSSLLCAALVAGSVLSQSAQSTDIVEEIKNPIVRKAIESLSFEDKTLDELAKEKLFKNYSEEYPGNAAYVLSELGNYYLKSKNPEKAAYSYQIALSYLPEYEDLVSFLHRIGVPEGKENDLTAIQKATKEVIGH